MTDKPDTMPPLPTPRWDRVCSNDPYTSDGCRYADAWDDDQMHAYARQHAEERCAALVEALEIARDVVWANLEALKEAYRGYPSRYASEERDLALIDAALAAHKEKQ